uniref:Uncharacterized protein n=1 Tax=Anopheles arabiensis TaxID=7173 RepID=A0A182IFB4_ANOAR
MMCVKCEYLCIIMFVK